MERLPTNEFCIAGTTKRVRRLAIAAAILSVLLASTPGRCAEEPLAGVAYTYADTAYRAYKIGDYATVIAKTRQAIAIRPDSARLRALLIDALFAQGNLEEADAVASEAISRFGDDAELLARQRNIREQLENKTKIEAFKTADEGFKAYDQKDYATAVQDARKAIEIDSSKQLYRILLVNSLIATDDLDEANKEVTEALVKFDNDAELLDRQRYIRQQIAAKPLAEAYAAADAAYKAFAKKDYATAVKEAQIAVDLDPLNRSYRDLLENAERAQKRPVVVQSRGAILAQRGYADQRRGDFAAAVSDFSAAMRVGLPTPSQSYTVRLALADSYLGAGDAQHAMDILAPFSDSSGYEMSARRGFALQAMKRSPEALDSFTAACASARTPRELAIALSARIALLAEMNKKAEARALFDQSFANGQLRPLSSADIANLALTVGNEDVASEYNALANQEKLLKGRSVLDAGYLEARRSRTKEGISYFKSGIDAYYAGELRLDPQELFAVRRQIAEMSRTWGAYASLTYSKTGAGPGAAFAGSPSGGNTLQPGVELYWRPSGYQDGRYLDVFLRAFETSYAQNGASGVKTTQGLYGLRFKPIGPVDLVFEVAHVFPLGDLARNDVLLRAAFFHGQGTDLRVDTWTWPTWQIYADYNRFVESSETVASADLRVGQSYRLDAINHNLVLIPHVGLFANYDNKLATAGAYAAGLGTTMRYWFREDKYTAPMSYIDLTAQYRFRLGGDHRAEGPFGQVLVNY
jgi:tetratricopeptide (TPR) repeat protein